VSYKAGSNTSASKSTTNGSPAKIQGICALTHSLPALGKIGLEMAAARSLDRSRFRQSKTGDQANTPGLRPIGYRALHEFFLLRARCAGR
jgi:hypothetical protein